jgi:hypothetical protein
LRDSLDRPVPLLHGQRLQLVGVDLIKREKRCRLLIKWFAKDKYERNERDSKRKSRRDIDETIDMI